MPRAGISQGELLDFTDSSESEQINVSAFPLVSHTKHCKNGSLKKGPSKICVCSFARDLEAVEETGTSPALVSQI